MLDCMILVVGIMHPRPFYWGPLNSSGANIGSSRVKMNPSFLLHAEVDGIE